MSVSRHLLRGGVDRNLKQFGGEILTELSPPARRRQQKFRLHPLRLGGRIEPAAQL